MLFKDFDFAEPIAKALVACKYEQATPVQEKAIPVALAGKDLIGVAQTGTGKTAAFLLPVLQRLHDHPVAHKSARVLILVPTRELATQVTDAIHKYAKYLQVKVVSVVGGMPYPQQIRMLNKKVDIIVSTPGRLIDHAENKKVDLSKVEVLILDEADRMLDMGFIDDMRFIVDLLPKKRQTMLFTATMDKSVSRIAGDMLDEPEYVEIKNKASNQPLIKQYICMAKDINYKNKILQHILSNEKIDKVIIFTATKRETDKLADELVDMGYDAGALHGDIRQHRRNKIIKKLRDGSMNILVATDVAARGIDVTNISHVINFDLPRAGEDYLHRIGRTGRAGKSGVAISFVSTRDMKLLKAIEQYTGRPIEKLNIEGITADIKQFKDASPRGKSEKSGKFSKSKKFDKPKRFEKSGKFEKKSRFDKEDKFEKPRKFAKSSRFEKSDKFEKSNRFEKSGKFDKSSRFEKADKFDKSSRFEKSDKFEKPKRFGKAGKFEKSNRFEQEGRFEKPKRFDKAGKFEKSNRFEQEGRFEKSKRFDRAGKSEKSNRFEKSDRFEKSNRFEKPGKSSRFGKSDKSESRFEHKKKPAAGKKFSGGHRKDKSVYSEQSFGFSSPKKAKSRKNYR